MNKERLLKLADHLERGKLGHKKFDYSTFNGCDATAHKCGTNGCAIGECPILFPNEWEFDKDGVPSLIESTGLTFGDINEFFELSLEEAEYLFVPYSRHPKEGNKQAPFEDATKEEVAAHIRKFVQEAK